MIIRSHIFHFCHCIVLHEIEKYFIYLYIFVITLLNGKNIGTPGIIKRCIDFFKSSLLSEFSVALE